ncbi:hypothetical protein ACFY2M_37805 [Streptomyces sp. NPDC001276]|uniref:hypothetical protein n=1 Tax=Streptomyces sp. NPDC001276 TaxID=3364555 RepID=UPI0036A5C886
MLALRRAVDADTAREDQLPLCKHTPLMHLSEVPGRAMQMNKLAARLQPLAERHNPRRHSAREAGLGRTAKFDQDKRG